MRVVLPACRARPAPWERPAAGQGARAPAPRRSRSGRRKPGRRIGNPRSARDQRPHPLHGGVELVTPARARTASTVARGIRHILGGAELEAMPSHGVFVNTSSACGPSTPRSSGSSRSRSAGAGASRSGSARAPGGGAGAASARLARQASRCSCRPGLTVSPPAAGLLRGRSFGLAVGVVVVRTTGANMSPGAHAALRRDAVRDGAACDDR
jgi:hypothetical protein